MLAVTNGVLQCSILGPVLFTIYINDLTSVITHSQPAAYVDDSQLHIKFSVSDWSSAMAAVNQDLTDISKWCAKNSLLINPEKTKLVVIGSVQLIKRLPHISLSLLGKTSLVPRPVRAIRVTRGGMEPSAIARGVLGEFSRQA